MLAPRRQIRDWRPGCAAADVVAASASSGVDIKPALDADGALAPLSSELPAVVSTPPMPSVLAARKLELHARLEAIVERAHEVSGHVSAEVGGGGAGGGKGVRTPTHTPHCRLPELARPPTLLTALWLCQSMPPRSPAPPLPPGRAFDAPRQTYLATLPANVAARMRYTAGGWHLTFPLEQVAAPTPVRGFVRSIWVLDAGGAALCDEVE